MEEPPNPRRRFASFREFYPYYLAEHSHRWNRRLHLAGKVAVIALLVAFGISLNWLLLAAVPVIGYAVSWTGHYLIEHNRPATFGHPFYSLLGDLVMCRDMLIGRVAI